MENASKALIIVGSVLIALIVTSVFVWGWSRIAKYNQEKENIDTVKQIAQKNKEFASYNKKVLRGYELVSLANLTEDVNTRYSEENGFKKVQMYVKFLKDTTVVNAVAENKRNRLTSNYIDLAVFMSDYYDYAIDHGEKDFGKIFKESYFQCDNIIYNGEEEGDKGTALVQKMYFSQIRRAE